MDAALLLETFNSDEMDIWNNYNLFTDDNIISAKDSVKIETAGKLAFSGLDVSNTLDS
jgi:hypothetical protein